MPDENAFTQAAARQDGIISTGIEKLDMLLEGGIPAGFTVLVLTVPGSSAEILAKQIASHTKNSIYISTDEDLEEINNTFDRFHWETKDLTIDDISTKHRKNLLKNEEKRVNIYRQRSKVNIKELINIGSKELPSINLATEDFLASLSNTIVESQQQTMLLNSLDFYLNHYPQEDVLKTIYAAKISVLEKRGVLFLVMTKGIHGELFERKLETLADCVLELDVLQRGSDFERILSVKKMRNYAKKIGIARYGIDDSGFVIEMIQRIM